MNFLPSWLRVGLVFWVSALGFSACPGDPHFDRSSVIHLINTPIQPSYFHDHSTAQIEAMRHAKYHSRMMHSPGITLAEHELNTQYQIGGLRHGRSGGCCIWVDSLKVDFSYHKMDVYVSSQYPEGGCPYRVILAHENQHVAINQAALGKYLEMMRQALAVDRTIPTKANPLAVSSMGQGKAIVSARVNRLIYPIYDRFKKAVMIENGKIDTLENYKRTQAQCDKW